LALFAGRGGVAWGRLVRNKVGTVALVLVLAQRSSNETIHMSHSALLCIITVMARLFLIFNCI